MLASSRVGASIPAVSMPEDCSLVWSDLCGTPVRASSDMYPIHAIYMIHVHPSTQLLSQGR